MDRLLLGLMGRYLLILFVHMVRILFGHGPQFVKDAVTAHVNTGVSYGTTSFSKHYSARKISEITGFDKVRLVNSGTEATMTAIRLRRGYTGKSLS